MENIFQSVRVFVVGKNGKLCDKFDQNIDLNCEHDPQGMRIKLSKGIIYLKIYFYALFHG